MSEPRPRKRLPDIDVNTLREILNYNPETGCFIWSKSTGAKSAGSPAGKSVSSHGYSRLGINGKVYGAHRVAWAHFHGEWPTHHVDHINEDRADNRISNLRCATHGENLQNRGKQKNNTSGHKGVCWSKAAKKWVVHIQSGGPMKYLGCFNDIDDAAKAYQDAAKLLHGEFAKC